MDGNIDPGKSVAPISSWNPNEMNVTGDRKERQEHKKRDDKKRHSDKNVYTIVHELNEAMVALGKNVCFVMADGAQHHLINMMDADTKKVIRQLTVDELLNTPNVSDLLGVLVDKDV